MNAENIEENTELTASLEDPEAGMATAEYAIGTVAATSFAGLLVWDFGPALGQGSHRKHLPGHLQLLLGSQRGPALRGRPGGHHDNHKTNPGRFGRRTE